MKTKSIAQLRQLLQENRLTEKDISQLKNDERKGVQQLVQTFERKRREHEEKKRRFRSLQQFDKSFLKDTNSYVAGVDEAGRGPLAGPVVSAAVILPKDFKGYDLIDSKQLTESVRNELYNLITNKAIAYEIAIVDANIIDEINILEATKQSMLQAIEGLKDLPAITLVDAVNITSSQTEIVSVTKGDQKSLAIAAASILAKVTRDRIMLDLNEQYPLYHFAKNKGYGSKEHLEALKKYGPSPVHRRSFSPVKKAIHSCF